jgi:hypothetical protein
MERELFQQEFLQAQFQKYAVGMTIIPNPQRVSDPDHPGKMVDETMIEAMQREAADALTGESASKAGGGKKGKAAAAAGTQPDCSVVVILPGGKKVPYNEAQYLKSHACWDASFLIAHENQHVADCHVSKTMFDNYAEYAASDVRAYGVGVRKLRELIHETASRCGVEGSSEDSKPNPVDKKPEQTIPTPDQVKSRLDALKANSPKPPRVSASKGGTK